MNDVKAIRTIDVLYNALSFVVACIKAGQKDGHLSQLIPPPYELESQLRAAIEREHAGK